MNYTKLMRWMLGRPAKRHEKLVLHVGMDKTGTSTIQNFLDKNCAGLAKNHAIYYPKIGQWTDRSHHALSYAMWEGSPEAPKIINQLVNSVPRKCRTTLVSSELLFKIPQNPSAFRRFKPLLETFANVKVIVYVRRQDLWVQSRHKHSIISGNEIALSDLMEPHYCDYARWIDEWAAVAGRENISVRPFDASRLLNEDLIADFMDLLGISVRPGEFQDAEVKNESVGNLETEFKRVSNWLGIKTPEFDRINELLIAHTKVNKRPRNNASLLSASQRADLIERYRSVNDTIRSIYLPGMHKELFESFEPAGDAPWDRNADCDAASIEGLVRFIGRVPQVRAALLDKAGDAPETTDEVFLRFKNCILDLLGREQPR